LKELLASIDCSFTNKLAFEGEINLSLSLALISVSSEDFCLVKLVKLGFRERDLGDTSFLEGGVAKILDFDESETLEVIIISKVFCKLILFILVNLNELAI
jgi:hypothetical protein